MAEVPIRIRWKSQTQEIAISPDWAELFWGYGDTARWYFDSDDPKVSLQKIVFDGSDPKGPFEVLDSAGPVGWVGAGLKHETREDKYTVTLSNGKVLDPGIRDTEYP